MDDAGRILVIARGLRGVRFDDPVMQWPIEVDVSDALGKARQK